MSAGRKARDYAAHTQLLLRELDYSPDTVTRDTDSWRVSFQDSSGFSATASAAIDRHFIEISVVLVFSVQEQEFLRQRMETLLEISRFYGCYFELETSPREIRISLISKLYFVSLDYYALEETLVDIRAAAADLVALFQIDVARGKGNKDGHP